MLKFTSVRPAPVIVAFFQGGEQVRLSFSQPADKRGRPIMPWRFGPVMTMVKTIIGDERARAALPGWAHMAEYQKGELPKGPAATDVLCYFIEWQGEIFRDEPTSQVQLDRARKASQKAAKAPERRRVAVYAPKKKPARKRARKRAAA